MPFAGGGAFYLIPSRALLAYLLSAFGEIFLVWSPRETLLPRQFSEQESILAQEEGCASVFFLLADASYSYYTLRDKVAG